MLWGALWLLWGPYGVPGPQLQCSLSGSELGGWGPELPEGLPALCEPGSDLLHQPYRLGCNTSIFQFRLLAF